MNRKEKFEIGQDKNIDLGNRISLLYSGSPSTSSLIAAIPVVGTYIDKVLTNKAQEFTIKRIEFFISELSEKIEKLNIEKIVQDDETMFDLFLSVFEKVVRTKSEEKIRRFAILTSNCLSGDCTWNETDSILNLANELSDIHMKILIEAQECDDKLIVTELPQKFTFLTKISSSLFCSDLVSRGLLKDEGPNLVGAGTIEQLSSTELTDWFLAKMMDCSVQNT